MGDTYYHPARELGELFHDVQMARVFPDSKTFADYRPKSPPAEVRTAWLAQRDAPGFDLAAFVATHFDPPRSPQPPALGARPESMGAHLAAHWDYLTRQPGDEPGRSSLIPLPHPYVVPGGRFREIYYWDSYFTMLGLAGSGRWDLVVNMLDNFAWLIDTVGFIPNGNRSYFLGRSQPPFFAAMVMLYAEYAGLEAAAKYLPQLEREYRFWMAGEESPDAQQPAYKRVVRLAPGVVLNRYWDEFPEPRPESFREDFELAEGLESEARTPLFRDLRAACESGWDFSSRWFEDGATLETVITTQILPVDLNSLLAHLEYSLGELHQAAGDGARANEFRARHQRRKAAMQRYFWDEETGFYRDYRFTEGAFTPVLSLAGLFPFFFDLAPPDHAAPAAEVVRAEFLHPGGLVVTPRRTGQQWDAPNGWPPLTWVAVRGLADYGEVELARDIARRWLALNEKVYRDTGKMMEKYDVTDLERPAGGGEYPTQDGFGWTNGVALRLQQLVAGEATN